MTNEKLREAVAFEWEPPGIGKPVLRDVFRRLLDFGYRHVESEESDG